FSITRAEDDKGILFHHRRRFPEGDLLFLANTSIEFPSSGSVECSGAIDKWDLETGRIATYSDGAQNSGSARTPFSLPPCGSLLLFVPQDKTEAQQRGGDGSPPESLVSWKGNNSAGGRDVVGTSRPHPFVGRAQALVTNLVPAAGPLQIRRLEPNVLVLDYVDI